MEFRVLGRMEALRDGESVDLGSRRQATLLALLLTTPGEVWSTDRIIDAMWADDGSTDRQNALWVYVSGLRSALEPDRAKRSEGTMLRTRAPGYVLDVDADQIDAVRFERLLAEGRSLVEVDPDAASLVLGEALSLWRGRPYEEFTYESWAVEPITRLDGLRLDAVEHRIDADLRRGLAREVVSELESLVREHPLRERIAGQLMQALFQSGRQADALRTYQQLRRRLGDELGIEPGLDVQRLEERIVLGDAELEGPAGRSSAGASPRPGLAVRGYELREAVGERAGGVTHRAFQPGVGREVAVTIISSAVANDPGFVRRFDAETQRVAGLEHPHIVPLYDFWREPDAAYLVTRQVGRGTLADELADGALDRDRLVTLIDQIGSALEQAHRSAVVHGTLDARSVVVDETGNAYLSNFDLLQGEASGREPRSADDDIRGFAELIAHAATGRSAAFTDLVVGLDGRLAEVLDGAVRGDAPFRDAASLRLAAIEALHAEPAASAALVADNPYKGLRSFGQSDAEDFFGRERMVERLIARLGGVGRSGSFVAVVGPSGSGKSSVVRAGLLPAIRRGAAPGSDRWFVVEMLPGHRPFEQFETALLGVAVNPPASLFEQLHAPRGVQRAVDRVLPDDDAVLVLVIDQFEELFTQSDPDEAERFLDALVDVVDDDHARIKVVVTLRADFYDRPLRHRGIGELLRSGTELLTPMSPEELERAIAGPAERAGIECEPALVTELVAEVIDRPATLPLLQYTLTELFDRRSGARLGVGDYREFGGVSGALVARAEAIFVGLEPDEQEAAEQLFLRLVTLGEGSGDTRRRAVLSELTSVGGAGRYAERIADRFARHRLLVFDRDPVTRGPTVEIAHEALIGTWSRFQRWIEAARSDVRSERRLAEAATDWATHDEDPAFLMTGSRLAQYDGWDDDPPVALTASEHQYLRMSSQAEQQRLDVAEVERQREITQRRRSRLLLAATAVMALVIALGAVALFQQRRADQLADQIELSAEARRVAAQARVVADDDPELSTMLAIEAARATASTGEVTVEAVDALHVALYASKTAFPSDVGPAATRASVGAGVFLMPPDDLVALAQEQVSRAFTGDECRVNSLPTCSDPRDPLPSGLAIEGGDDAYAAADVAQPLAGARVEVTVPLQFDQEGLRAEFAAFTDRTGIVVEVFGPRTVDDGVVDIVREDEDISLSSQPAFLRDVEGNSAIDVTRYLDRDALEARSGTYLTNLLSVDDEGVWPSSTGPVYGIWTGLSLKPLLWHGATVFDDLGREPPTTWDDLIAVSDEIVADGETPWCLPLDETFAAGWPATDLIESAVLRTAGPDFYDSWVSHAVAFDDPVVVEAARRVGALAFTPGYLSDGAAVAARTEWFDGVVSMVGETPACSFSALPNFVPAIVSPPAAERLGVVDFPVIDPQYADARVGGGNFVFALSDRPEVREVMTFIASDEFGSARVVPGTGYIPPSLDFDLDLIANPRDRRLTELAHASIRAESFRFDASDLMPTPVGLGSFWRGMVEWFEQGPGELDRIMAEIETTWPDGSTDFADEPESADVRDSTDPGELELTGLDRSVVVTVPDGWTLQLSRDGWTAFSGVDSRRQSDRDVGLFRPIGLADPRDPGADPEMSARWPRNDIDGWLEQLVDGIVVTEPERTELGGAPALYFEVEITDSSVCGEQNFCVGFVASGTGEFGIEGHTFDPGFHYRIWWIDSGFGPPLAVIAGTTRDDRDFHAEADVLLDSLVIG